MTPEEIKKVIQEAPERLKRVKEFQKRMDEQQKISIELLLLEITI